ncbi:alkaline phosphatase family protein [Mariniluteicoccus endophyticus]
MAVFPQEMVLPAYGRSTLSDVLPSIASQLGVPGAEDVLGLPEAERWVLMLVDGLGDLVLAGAAAEAPFLTRLREGATAITSGVPSTTVTSLTCLGTGRTPGEHGMAGYMCRVPETGQILNPLLWDVDVAPDDFQACPTWFQMAAAAGVAVGSVSPARFEGSGLTRASLRGPVFHGIDEADEDDRVARTVAAATGADRTLVYAYERELDHTGHGLGVASPQWHAHLRRVDALCARLRAELPDDVRLVVTGDHGMIDIPGRNFLIVEDEPGLDADIDEIAGEGRLRQLFTRRPDEVARRYADRLGDHAWVRTRDEAIDEGWFGPVADHVRLRFGDVLVAQRTDWALMTRRLPRELGLVGMHGSLTPVEMTVPLLVS